MLEASIKLGVPLNSAETVQKFMEDAGYIDVVQVIYKWPLNRWPADNKMKKIGKGDIGLSCCIWPLGLTLAGVWSHEAITSSLSGVSIALFTRALNWSVEETEVLLANVRKDMKNSRIHSYSPM
jgi:hypothetical protein